MFDLIVRNGQVVTTDGVMTSHIGVRDGRIAALLEPAANPESAQTIDASGMLVLPGLVDAHVHFREPGLTHKEDFDSGSRSAALGGVTTVMVMPTDNPVTTTGDQFAEKKELAVGRCFVDFALQAALAPDTRYVRELADHGAISFEIFLGLLGEPIKIARNDVLVDAMVAAKEAGRVVGATPFDDELAAAAARSVSGKFSNDREQFGASQPPAVEAAGVARAVLAHRIAGGRLHIRQMSTALGLAAFALAGEHATCEVTPHNLWLDRETLIRLGPVAKVVPPLRDAADVEAMRDALAARKLDIVATDHAPHASSEKAAGETELAKAPGGFPGVQTMLPVLLKLASDGVIAYTDIARVAAAEPARIFGLSDRKGAIRPGLDADLILVDPQTPMEVRNADQASKAGRTPFNGLRSPATLVLTILRGEIVMDRGKIVAKPRGKFVSPSSIV